MRSHHIVRSAWVVPKPIFFAAPFGAYTRDMEFVAPPVTLWHNLESFLS